MTSTPSPRSRLRRAAALVGLVAVLGTSVGACAAPGDPTRPVVAPAGSDHPGTAVVLVVDGAAVPATLADDRTADDLASLLPLTVTARDPMGQAKLVTPPRPLDATGAATTLDPETGGIYYAPDAGVVAIFYDDLGQTVPPPGLVRLGWVDAGLDRLGRAGARDRVTLDVSR